MSVTVTPRILALQPDLSSINFHPKINAKLEGYSMERKKRATGLGSWPHALSCCGLFFPVSYYTWSAAWMSQESEKKKKWVEEERQTEK